jgi:hypothetical protein
MLGAMIMRLLLLSKENLQAMGSGFLKMQPMAVFDAALFASSDEDVK